MIEDIKNHKINWIDGMKISKNHFLELQDYVSAMISDAVGTQLSNNDYGFLSSYLNDEENINVTVDTHNSLNVQVNHLKAITRGGIRIEITSNTAPFQEEKTLDPKTISDAAYIILTVDTSSANAVAFGERLENELPPRAPYLTNSYAVALLSEAELSNTGLGANQLPIAKIINSDGTLEIQDFYIPPCVYVEANEQLVNFYNRVDKFLKVTEKNVIQIVQKVNNKRSDNPIADALRLVVDRLHTFLSERITSFKWKSYHQKPMEVMNTVVSFARLFKNSVDISPSENKEALFNYFGEWSDKKGGDYEQIFTEVINLSYTHYDTIAAVSTLVEFMTTIEKLFTTLTQVDYIGKRREMGLFVNENKVEDVPKQKSGGPSFLAE